MPRKKNQKKVVGANRRFLSHITRHQNEVKFTNASLQYSNYSGETGFVKPYEILTAPPEIKKMYERNCRSDMDCYEQLCKASINHYQLQSHVHLSLHLLLTKNILSFSIPFYRMYNMQVITHPFDI